MIAVKRGRKKRGIAGSRVFLNRKIIKHNNDWKIEDI